MVRCKTCKKILKEKEVNFCSVCNAFHNHKYSKKDLELLLETYDLESDE